MRSAELSVGRIFVLRLETGEVIHEVLEKFASDNHIKNATVSIVGGVDKGSKMVSGPHLPIIDGKIDPYIHTVEKESEVTGFGTIFCDENGTPIFHMHGSAGREGGSSTGCFRAGMIAWLVLEVVVTELIGTGPVRKTDPATGFKILEIE
ncbi:MAG: PPC domain-containing DNA-binding protein [Candidatus Methanomethylophilaceae archaeon]|jgi:predicted DNA-binding protein with PD1-like motif